MAKVEIVGSTRQSKETVSRAVEKALAARVVDLEERIQKLRATMGAFEVSYGMKTEAFSKLYAAGDLKENLDYMEWRACEEILDDLVRERETLLEIKR